MFYNYSPYDAWFAKGPHHITPSCIRQFIKRISFDTSKWVRHVFVDSIWDTRHGSYQQYYWFDHQHWHVAFWHLDCLESSRSGNVRWCWCWVIMMLVEGWCYLLLMLVEGWCWLMLMSMFMLVLVNVKVGLVDVQYVYLFDVFFCVSRGSLLYFIWAFVAAWQSNIQFHKPNGLNLKITKLRNRNVVSSLSIHPSIHPSSSLGEFACGDVMWHVLLTVMSSLTSFLSMPSKVTPAVHNVQYQYQQFHVSWCKRWVDK